jgi:DNA-binding response OmpR family regulator
MKRKAKKIIIVEDDPYILDIYVTKLEEAGFSVDIAENGKKALKKVKEEKPDLLLLDIMLPDIDGWKLFEKITSEPHLEDLKVIVLSNLDQRAPRERSLRLGVIKHFIKSNYTPSEIVEEIKKILK